MNLAQAVNPCLPSYEYLAEADAHTFGERVYLFGSHDKYNGKAERITEFICWSADVNELADWRYEGVIFSRKKIRAEKGVKRPDFICAPNVCVGQDGKYYLYFNLGATLTVGVAVCNEPTGEYEFLGVLRDEKGNVLSPLRSPALLRDGQETRLYAEAPVLNKKKFVRNCIAVTSLNADMVTAKEGLQTISLREKQTGENKAEGSAFGGAPSVRKLNGKYYFVYRSDKKHELCYAVSARPTEGFTFGGVLLSVADIGVHDNTLPMNYYAAAHGCIEKIKNKYFLFYHRQTNRYTGSRQVCAEELHMWDGKIPRVKVTSGGLNGRTLRGVGEYKARIACLLYSRKGAKEYGEKKIRKGGHPYFEQTGKDRNYTPSQHIANFRHGATAAFRYFRFDGANQIIVTIKGNPRGRLVVSDTPEGKPVAKLRLTPCKDFTDFYAPLRIPAGRRALFFNYEGTGKFIFKGFTLQQVSRGNKKN